MLGCRLGKRRVFGGMLCWFEEGRGLGLWRGECQSDDCYESVLVRANLWTDLEQLTMFVVSGVTALEALTFFCGCCMCLGSGTRFQYSESTCIMM
jgi:hypothetical protein